MMLARPDRQVTHSHPEEDQHFKLWDQCEADVASLAEDVKTVTRGCKESAPDARKFSVKFVSVITETTTSLEQANLNVDDVD